MSDLTAAHPELEDLVERLDLYLWGHAMVRPEPGVMWGNDLELRQLRCGAVSFATCDVSGLPLFEEAVFHGLRAAEEWSRSSRYPLRELPQRIDACLTRRSPTPPTPVHPAWGSRCCSPRFSPRRAARSSTSSLIGTISSYFLGDSVEQFSLTIGFFLAAMGAGSWISRLCKRDLITKFISIELWLGLAGGCSVPALYAVYSYSGQYRYWMILFILVIGGLVGARGCPCWRASFGSTEP